MKIRQKLITYFYLFLPKKTVNYIGSLKSIKYFRNKILRPNNKEFVIKEDVIWNTHEFMFNAPIKIALKAKKSGIENKLLRNSIEIINKNIDNKNITIFDVGANYGFISLVLQKAFNENANIFSFEPHPEIVNTFNKSIIDHYRPKV